MIEAIGYLAGILTTFSFLPQTLKIIKEKNVQGISLSMYSAFATGVFLWLVYGIFISNYPVIIFNAITLAFAVAIIANIFKYKK